MMEDEKDPNRFRILWVGGLALLRAVGHVLHKVDSENQAIGRASQAAYNSWKADKDSHKIFFEFIEKSRNLLLKEYESLADSRGTIPIVVFSSQGSEIHELDENLFRPLVNGYGAGEDARDVYLEAIDWWDSELTAIEKSASD